MILKNKKNIAVLFGGTNTEHEVSTVSAQGVIANLDKSKYEVRPILITKENKWLEVAQISASYHPVGSQEILPTKDSIPSVNQVLGQGRVDLVFPLLHGPYGEDGTIQGLLELLHLPYVGSGVAASAVCMDKVLEKQLCEQAGIPVTKYTWFTTYHWQKDKQEIIKKSEELSYPLFVKPANQGSSVGITKAHSRQELTTGIEQALTRDTKVIVEQTVANTREIECAILGNENPEASVLGEVIPSGEFYDYESKYLDGKSRTVIPADLPNGLAKSIKDTAKKSFTLTSCSGLARVDFLVDKKSNKFYLNEINTMPGFTPISMYPKLWEASGLPYAKLLDRLVELALSRHATRAKLNNSR